MSQSNGLAPSTYSTGTFSFVSDGVNPVDILFQTGFTNATVTREVVLNGFTLEAIPEPMGSTVMGMAALGLLLYKWQASRNRTAKSL